MHHSKLGNWTISYRNSEEYHYLKREIWSGHLYYLESDNPINNILDIGAHIGVSTLYFAQYYPNSTIVSVEPNPLILPILKQNIKDNQLENRVKLVEGAITNDEGVVTLYHQPRHDDWQINANLSSLAWQGDSLTTSSSVKGITLKSILDRPVDILKMDIEGSEVSILQKARKNLHLAKHLLIEFHPKSNNQLDDLTFLFDKTGFEYTFWKGGKAIKPELVRGLVLIHASKI